MLWGCLSFLALAQEHRLMNVSVGSSDIIGIPIHWGSEVAMLEASGRIRIFDQDRISSHRLLRETFRPHRVEHVRGQLQAELGQSFETAAMGPYVIAAPNGKVSRWQDRFNVLYSGFRRYFQVRGWKLGEPNFPLVVIVYPNREQFRQHAQRESGGIPSDAIGSFFPSSNRCILYQLPGVTGTNWSETEATIVHEAVHQLAFNTGIHERLFSNPLWCVEGLACMFEEPAVYDLRVNRSTISTRMNSHQIRNLGPILKNATDLESRIASLITSDDLFRSDATQAYAISWALTFYLSERMPREYETLLSLQMRRGFGEYSAGQRLSDFRSAIGVSPSMLANQMQRLLLSSR